jgi:hypothetical protein
MQIAILAMGTPDQKVHEKTDPERKHECKQVGESDGAQSQPIAKTVGRSSKHV